MIKTFSLLAIVVHVSMIITDVLTELDSDVEPNGMKDKDSMLVMAHIGNCSPYEKDMRSVFQKKSF